MALRAPVASSTRGEQMMPGLAADCDLHLIMKPGECALRQNFVTQRDPLKLTAWDMALPPIHRLVRPPFFLASRSQTTVRPTERSVPRPPAEGRGTLRCAGRGGLGCYAPAGAARCVVGRGVIRCLCGPRRRPLIAQARAA
jgi:hypothetical protein